MKRAKYFQLWLNQHYNVIKNSLILFMAVALLLGGIVSYVNTSNLLDKVQQLSSDNKSLSQDNKLLNQQNKAYAQQTQAVVLQNRSFIKCLASIFAQYTHDFVPVNIKNLGTCALEINDTLGNTSQGNSDTSSSSLSSSPNHTTATTPSQPKNPQGGGGSSGGGQGNGGGTPPPPATGVQKVTGFVTGLVNGTVKTITDLGAKL